jgi:hypothetical protein
MSKRKRDWPFAEGGLDARISLGVGRTWVPTGRAAENPSASSASLAERRASAIPASFRAGPIAVAVQRRERWGEALTLGEDGAISLLNQAKYLFLRHISELEENTLRLVAEEAIADRTETVSNPHPASPFAEIRKGTSPIKAVEGCRTFELQWEPLCRLSCHRRGCGVRR